MQPVKLPKITPAPFEGDQTTVKLPAPYDHVVVGGGGRFLVFHLKQLRQLAILDVSAAKVEKYLSLPSDDITFGATANKLVVVARERLGSDLVLLFFR